MSRTPWVPYKIPPVVEKENPDDVYALSFSDDAQVVPQTNPSKFLEWKKIDPLPQGTNLGDIIYWDPSSGENGEWVILENPQPENNLEWKVFDVCENGQPKNYLFLVEEIK
jgi:hypothetical protein